MAGESVQDGGKGDSDRTKDRKAYQEKMAKVKFEVRDKTKDTFKVTVNGKGD